MTQDEPSDFALELCRRLVAGEDFPLTEREMHDLTEYEQLVLNKTARKQGYTVWYSEALRHRYFEKDRSQS